MEARAVVALRCSYLLCSALISFASYTTGAVLCFLCSAFVFLAFCLYLGPSRVLKPMTLARSLPPPVPTADDLMSMDYSFDLVIYSVFTLLVTTATFWRGTWKALQRRDRRQGPVKVLLLSSAVHLLRELLIIKVSPPPSPLANTFVLTLLQLLKCPNP